MSSLDEITAAGTMQSAVGLSTVRDLIDSSGTLASVPDSRLVDVAAEWLRADSVRPPSRSPLSNIHEYNANSVERTCFDCERVVRGC